VQNTLWMLSHDIVDGWFTVLIFFVLYFNLILIGSNYKLIYWERVGLKDGGPK
jgi:hypothetical protein